MEIIRLAQMKPFSHRGLCENPRGKRGARLLAECLSLPEQQEEDLGTNDQKQDKDNNSLRKGANSAGCMTKWLTNVEAGLPVSDLIITQVPR